MLLNLFHGSAYIFWVVAYTEIKFIRKLCSLIWSLLPFVFVQRIHAVDLESHYQIWIISGDFDLLNDSCAQVNSTLHDLDGDTQDYILSDVLLKLLRDTEKKLAIDFLSLLKGEFDTSGRNSLSLNLFALGLIHQKLNQFWLVVTLYRKL